MVYWSSSVKKLACAMKITHLSIVMATGACGMLIAGMLVPAPCP
jgi:hypothetical protein